MRSVKVTLSSDCEVGASRAPKQPWATRAISSIGKDAAIPATRLAIPKPSSPAWYERRMPATAQSLPPKSTRPPKARL